jgi:hypothetical protein
MPPEGWVTPESIGIEFVPTPAQGVAEVVVGGEQLVGLGPSRSCHLLNSAAVLVWPRFDGERDLATIVADLADMSGEQAEVIAADVVELTQQLGGLGLLDGVAPHPAKSPGKALHGRRDTSLRTPGPDRKPSVVGQLSRRPSSAGQLEPLLRLLPAHRREAQRLPGFSPAARDRTGLCHLRRRRSEPVVVRRNRSAGRGRAEQARSGRHGPLRRLGYTSGVVVRH